MEAYDDEESMAAKILVSLRTKPLLRSPEWVLRPEEEVEEGCDAVLEALPWGKTRPPARRGRADPEVWRKLVRELGLGVVEEGRGAAGVGSSASSSGEDAARSEPHRVARKVKVKVKTEHMAAAARRPGVPVEFGAGAGSAAYFGAKDAAPSPPHRPREKTKVKLMVEFSAARGTDAPRYYAVAAAVGSVPSTSGVDRARSRSRPRSSEKAAASAQKEDMDASSPETPLDYAAAVGSGASSSGEDAAAGSRAKRKAPGAVGSGGASSGDEGCSTPPKRAHLAAATGAAGENKVEEAKIADDSSTDYRDKNGVLLFDLNEGLNEWEE